MKTCLRLTDVNLDQLTRLLKAGQSCENATTTKKVGATMGIGLPPDALLPSREKVFNLPMNQRQRVRTGLATSLTALRQQKK